MNICDDLLKEELGKPAWLHLEEKFPLRIHCCSKITKSHVC